jgi:hypothetical protein
MGLIALSLALMISAGACRDDREEAVPTQTGTAVATGIAASPTPVGAFITILEPGEDAKVSAPFRISGAADVFEAALTVDLIDAADRTLCVRHIMATSGTGTPGTWETTLAIPPPRAAEDVTVRAYSFSAKDGAIENLVARSVTLSADRPAIFVTSPVCGAKVAPGSTLFVQGRALVFEAALVVELRDASGTALVTQTVNAASGTEESDFTTNLVIPAALPSGFYDLVAFDYSARDGSVEHEFSMQIVVEP